MPSDEFEKNLKKSVSEILEATSDLKNLAERFHEIKCVETFLSIR